MRPGTRPSAAADGGADAGASDPRRDPAQAVRRHYAPETDDAETDDVAPREADLVARVARAADQLLTAPTDAPLDDARLADARRATARLAGLDQFHVGGLAATQALAALAGLADLPPGAAVLDAGSGLGGPSRYLAQAYGCRVVGVDLTPAYVAVARDLAERTGLGDRVLYEVGDLARLPFADAAFDLVWTQHVVMNVRDRDAVYREVRRVLRPGGALAFHDVLAADGHPALHFPVPWAETGEASTLLTEAETRAAFGRAGLAPGAWRDVTAEAVATFTAGASSATGSAPGASGAPAPSLATVMGPRFAAMGANLARNLREGRVRLVMGRCDVTGVPAGPRGTDPESRRR